MALTQPQLKSIDGVEDDGVAHLISKADWAHAYVDGQPVEALCGKLWVPHRDPENLPLCTACTERFLELTGQTYPR